MSESLPVITLPTNTDEKTVAEVRAAGYVPVLTDNPESVRVVMLGSQIETTDLLMAALSGLCCAPGADEKKTMVETLYRRLKDREARENTQGNTDVPKN